jgi:hypothetical protein
LDDQPVDRHYRIMAIISLRSRQYDQFSDVDGFDCDATTMVALIFHTISLS